MKTVLLLPDGVGVRNFLLTHFASQLTRDHDLVALHTVPETMLAKYQQGRNTAVEWLAMAPYAEGPLSMAARYTMAYAHLYWADTRAMRFSAKIGVRGSWRTRAVHRASQIAGRILATPAGIRAAARVHAVTVARSATAAGYRELFARLRPDVVFSSHQRPPIVIPAVVAARSLGIPTATFIFSWDNLCGKGRIPAPFDHFLVWSAHMREELQRYYPDVASERIHVVGTPQFDFCADPDLLEGRAEFFARIGADSSRPLICYSGGDPFNSPEDQDHLRVLLEHVRAGRIRPDAQVVLRPAPVDPGTRFTLVRRDHPELITCQPAWVRTRAEHWDQILPLPEDARFLTNLTRHVDVNVNLGSTMSLDFAIHDRPVVNIAFDVASPPPFGTPIWDHHYRFEHYQPVIALGAVRFARTAAELATHVAAYLADPALDREARRRLVELQLGRAPGESSGAVIDALRRIAERQPPLESGRVAVSEPRTA